MIIWDVSPEIFSFGPFSIGSLNLGPFSVRWYGLLFAASFVIGFQIMNWIFKIEKKSEKDLNDLVWYMILGTVIGARLGHCLFYNPEYYLSNPLEILKIWQGGLASHGAAVGILTAMYLYSKKKVGQSFLWILDRVVITVALAGSLIRLGNLFNSEIIGIPTDLPWGFVFTLIDEIPRHPAQLYESIFYLISFFILINIYRNKTTKTEHGLIFGLFLILIFGFRIFVEFIKEDQTAFEQGMILNMGQILSIPLVAYGGYLIYKVKSLNQLKK